MPVGTRSILYGAHQFILHPLILAVAWWRLYGFPWNPLLWAAFVVHDWGYCGKPNMDGPEGEEHPRLGATIMYTLTGQHKWWEFTAYHSRFWAKRNGAQVSRLCVADKYAIVISPPWLYLFLARLSGELAEYIERSETKYKHMNLPLCRPRALWDDKDVRAWHMNVVRYLRAWVGAHKDGAPDTWTEI